MAAFDCDDDGRSDLYLAGGSEPAALYRNESPAGGALRFTPITSADTDLTAVTGAYPLDIDSDGHTDLAVLRVGEDVLLRGRGECRFERANETFGFDGGDTWTVGFSATWEGSNCCPRSPSATTSPPTARRARTADWCGRRARFAAATVLTPGYCTLSMLFSDWRRSGRRDLRLTNDRHYYRDGSDQLWRIVRARRPGLHRGRRVASAAGLGDGHRQPRPHG